MPAAPTPVVMRSGPVAGRLLRREEVAAKRVARMVRHEDRDVVRDRDPPGTLSFGGPPRRTQRSGRRACAASYKQRDARGRIERDDRDDAVLSASSAIGRPNPAGAARNDSWTAGVCDRSKTARPGVVVDDPRARVAPAPFVMATPRGSWLGAPLGAVRFAGSDEIGTVPLRTKSRAMPLCESAAKVRQPKSESWKQSPSVISHRRSIFDDRSHGFSRRSRAGEHHRRGGRRMDWEATFGGGDRLEAPPSSVRRTRQRRGGFSAASCAMEALETRTRSRPQSTTEVLRSDLACSFHSARSLDRRHENKCEPPSR